MQTPARRYRGNISSNVLPESIVNWLEAASSRVTRNDWMQPTPNGRAVLLELPGDDPLRPGVAGVLIFALGHRQQTGVERLGQVLPKLL